MHITNLVIRNFRGIKSLEISPKSRTMMLCGPNGSGKTSALDAIRFCLLGRVRDANDKALSVADLVGPYGDKTLLSLTLKHEDQCAEITIRITGGTATLQTTPAAPAGADKRRWIFECLGLDYTRAALALDPLRLMLGGDLLGQLSGGDTVDPARLAQALGGETGMSVLSEYGIRVAQVNDLSAAADTLYAERTEVNRKIRSAAASMDKDPPQQPNGKRGPLDRQHLKPLQEQIQKALGKRDALDEQISAGVSGRSADEIARDLKRLNAEYDALVLERPVAPQSEPCPVEHADAVIEKHIVACRDVGRLRTLLASQDDSCPACGRPYDPETLKRKEAEFRAELQGKEKELKALTAQKEAIETWAAANTAAAQQHGEQVREWNAREASLKERLAVVRAEAPARESLDDLRAAREAAQVEGERLHDILEALEAWVVWQDDQASLQSLRVRSEVLTGLITALRAPSTAALFGGSAARQFEQHVSSYLEDFGYEVSVDWDRGSLMLVTDDSKRPVSQASSGERVLLQCAIADAYGAGALALIDNYEALDEMHETMVAPSMSKPLGGRVVAMAAAQPFEAPNDVDVVKMRKG